MKYRDDKTSSKLLFLALFIVVLYLGFFNFDINAAYQWSAAQIHSLLAGL